MSAGDMAESLVAVVECPSCHHRDEAPLRVSITTARRAAKQPTPPQFLRVCDGCNALLILTFAPAHERNGGER